MAFTSLEDAAFDVCFENTLTGRCTTPHALPRPGIIPLLNHLASYNNPSRHVELDIDIGADAKDWSGIQAAEKLKPVEIELKRIEETVNDIVQEMEYLRSREQKLRDTNESTNERVKWFALGTMGMLVGLGAWQVVYLRAYFRFVVEMGCGRGLLTLGIGRSISYKLALMPNARAGLEELRKSVGYDTIRMEVRLPANTNGPKH